MKTLELKHLEPYTHHDLKINNEIIFTMKGLVNEGEGEYMNQPFIIDEFGNEYYFEKCKPICHPLSDLIKPILPDGKIPLIELAKIAYSKWDEDKFTLHKNGYVEFAQYSFHFVESEIAFDCRANYDGNKWNYNCYVPNQKQLFDKLYQWHFAVDLPEGSWIDVNSLPENPYTK